MSVCVQEDRSGDGQSLAAYGLIFSSLLPPSQGPAGTPGPEGRQGEKGAKVREGPPCGNVPSTSPTSDPCVQMPPPRRLPPVGTVVLRLFLPRELSLQLFLWPHPFHVGPLDLLRPFFCPLGHIPCVCFRGILVLWAPQGRQALWVLRAQPESLALMV